ncbi:DNA/RNA non-specific endonuclease [Nitzschia inconspicua]|uniref:Endonuclease n=1 Tax=Nitzschia inconspicua TaxID=303405 RepID=A0A9K3Q6Y6_9STRA|nr:DNA/RNA non-specific endonuclease [Nitzschia inconspicua]
MASSFSTRITSGLSATIATAAAGCLFLWRNKGDIQNVKHHPMHTSNDAQQSYDNNRVKVVTPPHETNPDISLPSPASPTLPIRLIKPNPNLEIAFDVRTRTPIYALETLTKHTLQHDNGNRKRPQFYEDKNIELEAYRSKLSHYHKSGWDRGHLAPAADYPHDRKSTFTLCNVAPQNHMMNLTVWSSLEEWVRKVVLKSSENDVVYVVTGPLWLPDRQVNGTTFEYGYKGIGKPPSLVAVPTHFFKVVLVVKADDALQQFACFVVPNEEVLPSKKLEHYVVSWRDLETVTGLQFFPRWATPSWKDHADYLTQQQVISKRQRIESHGSVQPNLLLLANGGSIHQTTSRTFWKRVKNGSDREPPDGLQHLCSFGNCR